MKKHAIIPIFIPHQGCPNDCVFCNQRSITARSKVPGTEDVKETVEKYLSTLNGRGLETIEIAFFGGSFTGLSIAEQNIYLSIAKEYKDKNIINKIHLSTRPDYINKEILDNLKSFSVDIIELGVQSFDENVLKLSNRGHSSSSVYSSSNLIKEYGFELGLQLMIGLPGSSYEKDIFSAKELVKIKPSISRLYPTVVLKDTQLYSMYLQGLYEPLNQETAVKITKDMYKLINAAGIKIIRVGLKSSDIINDSYNSQVIGNSFHPAFRQLVEGEIARDYLEIKLKTHLYNMDERKYLIQFASSQESFSNMVGNNKINKKYFEYNYPYVKIEYIVDNSLKEYEYKFKEVLI